MDGTYELRAVPLTSIAIVTSRTVKVWNCQNLRSWRLTSCLQVEVDAIVERHLIAPMREAVKSLASIVEEFISAGTIPEIDWARIRSLEFQEALRSRGELVRRLDKYACTLCSDFEHHVNLLLVFAGI